MPGFEYEPIANDAVRRRRGLAFGRPWRTRLHRLEEARRHRRLRRRPASARTRRVEHTRGFAAKRDAVDHDDPMSRLYAFEPAELTGAAGSTTRTSGRRRAQRAFVATRRGGRGHREGRHRRHARRRRDRGPRPGAGPTRGVKHAVPTCSPIAANHGLVVAGAGSPPRSTCDRAPPQRGPRQRRARPSAYLAVEDRARASRPSTPRTLRPSRPRIEAGAIDTLLILGGNPAYAAPADLDFAARMAKASRPRSTSATTTTRPAAAATWHVNRAHYLESWGDVRAWDGTASVVQPLIRPLFDGHTAAELLAVAADAPVRDGQGDRQAPSPRRRLHQRRRAARRAARRLCTARPSARRPRRCAPALRWTAALAACFATAAARRRGLGGRLRPSPAVLDGRFANNGWLQELPDPITKLTWDNAAIMASAWRRSSGSPTATSSR